MLTLIAKLLNILNSDAAPSQIALAIAFAMLAGVNSLFSLIGLVTLVLIIVLRVNLSAFIALFAVFNLVTLAFSSMLTGVGHSILTNSASESLLTQLYNQYWFRLFELNNTFVMGAAVSSLILFIPIFALSYWLIIKYRQALMAFVNKFKVVQTLKASKFYQIYQTVKG